MTYALVVDGQIGAMYQSGNPFTLNGIQYPQNWLDLSTESEREAINLYPVVYGSEGDQRFYWVSSNTPTWDGGLKQVNISFTSTPMDLSVLKPRWIATEQKTAYAHLLLSDWVVVRAVEVPARPVPADWTAHRAAVRAECDRIVAAIGSSPNVAGLIAVVNSANWPIPPIAP